MDKVKISYVTDALCVWAYVSQVRMDELKTSFKDAVERDGMKDALMSLPA